VWEEFAVMDHGVLHVRYLNREFDVPLNRLGVREADVNGVKQALARYLAVPLAWLNTYALEHDRTGDLTLRQVDYD
jgi:hypothetical protein